MVSIRGGTDRQKNPASPKTEVGEIDTRAPFQSVKAAVSLFGEVAISRQRSTPRRSKLSSENVLDKETQLMLAQKEMGKIKEQLEHAMKTKDRALADLEKAKLTMDDLNAKLEAVNRAKQSALEAKEAVKSQAEQLELEKTSNTDRDQELEYEREQYLTTTKELDAKKQELTKTRQDFDIALEAKLAAFQQATEAARAAGVHSEKVKELSKEITDMKDATQQLILATARNQQDLAKMVEEKEPLKQSYKDATEEAKKKLKTLEEEYDPEMTSNLEAKLAETTEEIEVLQDEMKKAHASEMDTVRIITNDLNEATRLLQQIADEECTLRNLVSSLKTELEEVKKESSEEKEKEAERIAAIERKQVLALEEERRKLEELTIEAEKARKETEEMKKNAEAARIAEEEAQKKLEFMLIVAEEAKESEKKALEEMRLLSGTNETETELESPSKIKISARELESLKKKAEESEKLVEMKVAEFSAQLDMIHACKSETDKKIEANLIAIEEIKTATDMALKSAEMAEAAQIAVEAELQKRNDQDAPEE